MIKLTKLIKFKKFKKIIKIIKKSQTFKKIIFYLKKMGFKFNKKIIFYNKKKLKLKKKMKKFFKNRYLSRKKKLSYKLAKKHLRKWWFFKKKKKKKKMDKIKNFYNWTSGFFFINISKNFKFNKNIKESLKWPYYNFEFFLENQLLKKDIVKNENFFTLESDEMYIYNLDLFNIDLNINHTNEVQFFLINNFNNFNNIYTLKCNDELLIDDFENNKNNKINSILIKKKTIMKNIYSLNTKYKLNLW